MNTIPSTPPVPDPAWWSLPEVAPILAERDITGLYRWLQRRGWSQQQIASLTGQSQPEVSAIVHGRQLTSYDVLVRIADGLRIPRVLMGLGSCAECAAHRGAAVARGEDAMERRGFLAAVSVVAAGGSAAGLRLPAGPPGAAPVPARIGATDVAQIRAMAAHLRALDNRYGGGTMLDAARGFAGWAQGMLRSEYSEATGRDLKISLAELHELIGWAANDAGRRRVAHLHQAHALMLAREADEPGLVADVLFQIDRASLHWRDAAAPRVSEIGLAMNPGTGYAGTTANLHVNLAWAAALQGDARSMINALGRADEALAEAEDAQVPVWGSHTALMSVGRASGRGWLSHYTVISHYPRHRGFAELAIERGARALADHRRGPRCAAMDRAEVATAQIRVGDLNAGLANAHRVLDDMAGLRSARARVWLSDISRAAADHAGNPGADDLRARIAAAN